MKSWICFAATALLLTTPAWAHEAHEAHTEHAHDEAQHIAHTAATPEGIQLDAHTLQDIERHRGMAQAHAQAAQCLAEGTSYETCQKQLQTNCKGLALGKNCGMRHAH